MKQIEIDIDVGSSNAILTEAYKIILRLQDESLQISRLTEVQLNKLAYYFYTVNPYYKRIINIHSRLPLSSIFVAKPKLDDNDIVQDYIFRFYENFYKTSGLEASIKKATLYFNIFSCAYILIEDDFDKLSTVISDEENLSNKNYNSLSEEDQKFIDDSVAKYNRGELKSRDEIDRVIKKYIVEINDKYMGVLKSRVLSPFDIIEVSENHELDYYEYEINKSEYIVDFISSSEHKDDEKMKREDKIMRDLVEIGYSRSFVALHFEDKNSKTITITSDPSTDGIYMVKMTKDELLNENSNDIHSILRDLIKYETSSIKQQERINKQNKKVNFVKLPDDLGDDEVENIEGKIDDALDDENGSYVTTNIDLSVENVDFELNVPEEASDIREEAKQNILIGTGTPESLVNSDDSYGSSYLKLEILQNEYTSYRSSIKDLIEENIFKPIAYKKGFITVDLFGYAREIYPTLAFEIGSIINNQDFLETLKDLNSDDLVSNQTVLERYGIDQDEELTKIKRENEQREEAGV